MKILNHQQTYRWLIAYQYFKNTGRKKIAHKIESFLVEKNMKIVYMLASVYADKNTQLWDDFVQEGTLGLIKSFNTWNPKKHRGVSFYTHYKYWILKYIKAFFRDNTVKIPHSVVKWNELLDAKNLSVFHPNMLDSQSYTNWVDCEQNDTQNLILSALLKKLKQKNHTMYDLIIKLWFENWPITRFAESYNLTVTQCRNMHITALQWLKNHWKWATKKLKL